MFTNSSQIKDLFSEYIKPCKIFRDSKCQDDYRIMLFSKKEFDVKQFNIEVYIMDITKHDIINSVLMIITKCIKMRGLYWCDEYFENVMEISCYNKLPYWFSKKESIQPFFVKKMSSGCTDGEYEIVQQKNIFNNQSLFLYI